MARMWTTGFEAQSPTLEFGVNSGNIVTGTTPSMSTTIKRRGTCAARFQPSAAQSYIEHQITAGVVQRTFHRLYIRVDTAPSSDTNIYALGQSGFFPCSLRLKTDRTLLLRDSGSSTDLTGSMVLSLNRWYRVELDFTDGASGTGAFKMYVDGTLVADTLCSVINGFSRIRMGISGVAATADVYMDDVAINDDTGSVQNGLPGPGAVVHMLPNAAGDNNLWATAVGGTAGAANNFTRVNERTPNDSTSYNQTTATGTTTIDDFNLDSAATAGIGSADRITCVQVGGRVASDVTSAASIVYRLKAQAAGTAAESATVPVNNTSTAGAWSVHRGQSPRPYQLTSYVSPQDGSAWTAAKLDNAQIGYRGDVSSTVVRRVSALWALVDFVPIFALGPAAEGNSATHLEYTQAAIPVENLVDDFNDNIIDTALWPNSFGTISETGGRARVQVDTGYNAYSSAKAYQLADSFLRMQIFAPTLPEVGVTEAWAQALVKSNVDGTDLGFQIDYPTNSLYAFNRVGYYEAEPAAYTYSPTNHRWLRISESAGTVYFDASADGHAWTNLRSISTPSWVTTDGDLEIQLTGHRADGTTNFVEFDNVNVLFPQTVNLGPASTLNTGKPIVSRKRGDLGAAATLNTATALVVKKTRTLGRANTGDHATALDANKLRTLGAAATINQGRPLVTIKKPHLGIAAEGSSATSVGHARIAHPSHAAEGAAARPLAGSKKFYLGTAAEESAGHAATPVRVVPAHAANVGEAARPVTRSKRFHLGIAAEDASAQPTTPAKSRVIGHAATGDTSQPLAGHKWYAVAPAGSEDAGGATTPRKTAPLDSAPTADGAHALSWSSGLTVRHAAETTSARPVTARKSSSLGSAQTRDEANPIGHARTFHLAPASETNQARGITAAKHALLHGAATVEEGEGVETSKRSGLDPAHVETEAKPLHVKKTRALGLANEASGAEAVNFVQANSLGLARTADTATPLVLRKIRHLVNGAVADRAGGVAASKRRTVGLAQELVAAAPVAVAKTLVLGVAREEVEARGILESPKRRMLRTALVTEAARPVHISRQRPADVLQPGVTGPTLTPGTDDPYLIATSTTGGS